MDGPPSRPRREAVRQGSRASRRSLARPPDFQTEATARLTAKLESHMAQIETFPALTCRKCGTANPQVYFAPVVVSESGTCICLNCAKARNWLDPDGNLRPDVQL